MTGPTPPNFKKSLLRWENEGGSADAPNDSTFPVDTVAHETAEPARPDRRQRPVEDESGRLARQELEKVERRRKKAAEEAMVDEAIRRSINLHGA